jgi:outer membrane immunogenic protein
MRSKVFLAGIVAAAVMAPLAPLAAQAADLAPPPYGAPAYVEPVYAGWSGLYIGLNGGYGFGTSDWDAPAVSIDASGGMLGGTLGYNFQTGAWVWGAEGDFEAWWMKGDTACGAGGTCETKSDWFGTARLRLGYSGASNWLAYITGGAAFADITATNSNLAASASNSLVGWTLGAGIEYAWRSNWSVKLEYLYADLGSFDCGVSCGAAVDNVTLTTNLLRAGLNYRF